MDYETKCYLRLIAHSLHALAFAQLDKIPRDSSAWETLFCAFTEVTMMEARAEAERKHGEDSSRPQPTGDL